MSTQPTGSDQSTSLFSSLWDGCKGMVAGAAVVLTVYPGLRLKNQLQTSDKSSARGDKINFKESLQRAAKKAAKVTPKQLLQGARSAYSGSGTMAVNVLPQAGIARVVDSATEKYLDDNQVLVRKVFAGGSAGLSSNFIEFVVQNLNKNWEATSQSVMRRAYQEGGPSVFMRGGTATTVREASYYVGYDYLTPLFSRWVRPYVGSDNIADGVGAVSSGVSVGGLTNIPDVLRANKQWMERNWSYRQTFNNMGIRGLAQGMVIRMIVVSAANFLMLQGRKHL